MSDGSRIGVRLNGKCSLSAAADADENFALPSMLPISGINLLKQQLAAALVTARGWRGRNEWAHVISFPSACFDATQQGGAVCPPVIVEW
jgi:hypothetical protein